MAVADVEVDEVADADELELVVTCEEVEDEAVDVVEEVDAVVEDVATMHWSF